MILQALYNYYQVLLEDPDVEIALPGYSNAPIGHAINLSSRGDLLDIVPLYYQVQTGKKIVERPRRMNIPEQVKRSVNIAANFMCDNSAYVLGLADKPAKDPNYAQKRFEEFRQYNLKILAKADSPIARAVMAFLQNHDPQKARDHPVIARHLDELTMGSNIVFQVEGKFALDDPKIKRAWEECVSGQEAIEMQCLVSGGIEPIARLHPDIKGVRDAQTKGASLVSFNLDAFTSFGRGQGANAPISQQVASGYAVALNYLLSNQNPNRKIYLGDTTVVYWAESSDKRYASTFFALINPEFYEESSGDEKHQRDKSAEKTLGSVAGKVAQVTPLDIGALQQEELDGSTRFYVLGLAPSAARLSVRFFFTEPFTLFIERIMQHYADLQIEKEYSNQPDFLSPYRILAECVSPKITRREEEVKSSWSLLGGAFIRAVLTGTSYPEGLYAAIINRIRHDSDEEKRSVKINYPRAAYIKAHLLRKYRRQPQNPYLEALQMSLNESYSHPAYVLGRLFAMLERAQKAALGQNINATIKDRYFASACATPATVFPILLRLSQHHLNKAEYGNYLDRQIQIVLGQLEAKPFPPRLSLDDQGIFVLGYYHQRQAFYTKNEKLPADTSETMPITQ